MAESWSARMGRSGGIIAETRRNGSAENPLHVSALPRFLDSCIIRLRAARTEQTLWRAFAIHARARLAVAHARGLWPARRRLSAGPARRRLRRVAAAQQ